MIRPIVSLFLAGMFVTFYGNAQLVEVPVLEEPVEEVDVTATDTTYKPHLPDILKRSYTPRKETVTLPMGRVASDEHARTGSDGVQYDFVDSNEPNGPVFNWIDISGTGVEIDLYDDDVETVPMSFQFPFYGKSYDYVSIVSNGFLTFEINGGSIFNAQIPNTEDDNNLIVPFGDDLLPNPSGTIHYLSEPAQFTV